MKCPTCGGHMSDEDVNILSQVSLSPQQKAILDRVLVSYPKQIPLSAIVSMLYSGDVNGGPDGADNNVRVQIVNVNKVLSSYGWRIVSINHQYRLLKEDSAEMAQLAKVDGRIVAKIWSNDDIKLLISLYNDRVRVRNMVQVLKRTQNAIVGKLHRMRLDGEIV